MFFQNAIDLTDVTWKVVLSNDKIIFQGPQKYQTIQREILESFELLQKGKSIFKINTAGKTLIHRLKTRGKFSFSNETNHITHRTRITALLQKNDNPKKNITYYIKEGNKLIQQYSIDPEESIIYYHYENKKMEIRNMFGVTSPYAALKLRPEELDHLNRNVN